MDSPSLSPRCLSLEELCVRSAIDNVDSIRDVGHTDDTYLSVILPHCTAEQLMVIEEASRNRDLSGITNDLWLKWYERSFGEENLKTVMKRMKETNKSFKWKVLYQAKLREQEEERKEAVSRLRGFYKEADQKRVNRKIQQIHRVPPGKKRQFRSGGAHGRAFTAPFGKSSISSTPLNGRGRLMIKARQEFAASHDAVRISATRHKKPVVSLRNTWLGVRR